MYLNIYFTIACYDDAKSISQSINHEKFMDFLTTHIFRPLIGSIKVNGILYDCIIYTNDFTFMMNALFSCLFINLIAVYITVNGKQVNIYIYIYTHTHIYIYIYIYTYISLFLLGYIL